MSHRHPHHPPHSPHSHSHSHGSHSRIGHALEHALQVTTGLDLHHRRPHGHAHNCVCNECCSPHAHDCACHRCCPPPAVIATTTQAPLCVFIPPSRFPGSTHMHPVPIPPASRMAPIGVAIPPPPHVTPMPVTIPSAIPIAPLPDHVNTIVRRR